MSKNRFQKKKLNTPWRPLVAETNVLQGENMELDVGLLQKITSVNVLHPPWKRHYVILYCKKYYIWTCGSLEVLCKEGAMLTCQKFFISWAQS